MCICSATHCSAPPLEALVRLYVSFRPGQTVKDVMASHMSAFNTQTTTATAAADAADTLLDHRRVIAFGTVHGLLKRVHSYPICIKVMMCLLLLLLLL
jgi:Nitrogen permease regulator 2